MGKQTGLHQTKRGQTGHKDDAGKTPLSLVPVEPLLLWGDVHQYGALKYGRDNWRGGMPYTRLYDALQRHLLAWLSGEDCDPESGKPHLGHALTTLGMLVWMTVRRPDLDDRWKGK